MNSFRHIRLLALVLSAVACCVPVHAQDFKAGFVNTDRIFREANSAKAAQAKLEQEFSRREKDIIELGNSIKSMSEKYERDAPTLSESQRVSRQKQLVEQDRDLQRKRREFQEDRMRARTKSCNRCWSVPTGSSSRWPKRKNMTQSSRKPSTSIRSSTSPTK